MLKSMTGFGQAGREIDGVSYAVEIRAVNNRYFKTNFRLPETIAFLEDEISKCLRSRLYRGTVSLVLRLKNISDKLMFDIDEKIMAAYVEKLGQLSLPSESLRCEINLVDLLSLPGVMESAEPDEAYAEQLRKAVLEVTAEAVENLVEMRGKEGAAIENDLRANCQKIEEKVENIQARSPIVVQEYHQKLKDRVEKLLQVSQVNLDESTLVREVAVFADRCDISEEIARLGSHIEQFLANCETGDNAGRKLDFISQEMLREANTIASKASDAQIGRDVIELKTYIDRIKEQVQNVE